MASTVPFPLMPSKSTELRLLHFDEYVYTADPSTLLYKYIDAMCGDSGAGTLKKELFVQRLSGAMDGLYGSDLDYIFGNMGFLARSPDESYTYNPSTEMLTSDQWDEVRIKDAWYRARVKLFFEACTAGGTSDGVRLAVLAAVSVDCNIYEVWRYMDNFGLTDPLGRSPADTRQEVVVQPLKAVLEPQEKRLLREMLEKVCPMDAVMTINVNGLSVSAPVPVRAAASDSTYYQVEKIVTATPVLDSLPSPDLLAIDLDPTEKWLFSNSPELAPYAQFNITSEYGYYYLIGGGSRSPIDAVTYGTLQPDGSVQGQNSFEVFQATGQYTDWIAYDVADSPDNYPGGKYGITPSAPPALNPDRSPYVFPYLSQADYVAQKMASVIAMGGLADDARYKLPIQSPGQTSRTYTPDMAIAYSAPARDSTITSSWTYRRPQQNVAVSGNNPAAFVKSSGPRPPPATPSTTSTSTSRCRSSSSSWARSSGPTVRLPCSPPTPGSGSGTPSRVPPVTSPPR